MIQRERFQQVRRLALAAIGACTLIALLASCARPTMFRIDDFRVPAGATYGQVCFGAPEAAPAGAGEITSATYRADATYQRGLSVGPSTIEIQFYARTSAPSDTCIAMEAEGNLVLSDPIVLEAGEATRVQVGGSALDGERLAEALGADTYWLGAAVRNESFGFGDSVNFTNGTLSVEY